VSLRVVKFCAVLEIDCVVVRDILRQSSYQFSARKNLLAFRVDAVSKGFSCPDQRGF